jgi:ureidoglycolate lyase
VGLAIGVAGVTEHLRPRPLTARAFQDFGTVIETNGRQSTTINQGTADRFAALAVVEHQGAGTTEISIFRSRRPDGPVRAHLLERHPLGSQAFIPLERRDWLVVVARDPSEEPICFAASGDQGVQYGTGVWHHPLLILDPEQHFVVVDRAGPGANLEEAMIEPTLEVWGT